MRRISGRADLLHLHMAARGSAVRKSTAALIAFTLKLPTVVHLHGSVFDSFFRNLRPWQQKLLARVLRRCERVIVIGTYWRDFVINEVGLDPDRVSLVYNGVPYVPRGPVKDTSESPNLLMLGELGARKGTPDLIAALTSPELCRANWSATLAGNGPINEYRAAIASLGMSSRISVPGWQMQIK